ncbi:MAG: haloalkane dehalogenase [Planctomycetota bacterium]
MSSALRTPDERFESLPDYPFPPNYVDDLPGFEGLRVHYLDEGDPAAKEVFLCLHGEPSWSYLYRKMIPVFTAAGARVVAPDLLGFGRSDKPVDDATYTFDLHRKSLMRLIERLDLQRVTLVCQDWGGVLGLTIPHDMPGRFERLLIMNTGIMTGQVNEAFLEWKAYIDSNPDVPVGEIMRRHAPGIRPDEVAAYEAPFPDAEFKAGVRRFPSLIATRPDFPGVETSMRALRFWSEEWTGETFMAIGMQDPMLGPEVMGHMRELIAGCPEPMELPDAGHFVQEQGEQIAHRALEHFGVEPTRPGVDR